MDIPLAQIASTLPTRALKAWGVERIAKNIKARGYGADFPVIVCKNGKGYELISGNHRLEAAKREGLTEIPAIVHEGLTEAQKYQIALASNANAADAIPETFVDHAELVWRLLEGRTQQGVADLLGWKRGQVGKYSMLQGICRDAWSIVAESVVPTFQKKGTTDDDDTGTENVPVGTRFSERLLRPLSQLHGHQQHQLVRDLAKGKDRRGHAYTKAKFNADIAGYQSLNAALEHAVERLCAVIAEDDLNEYLGHAEKEIGKYAKLREDRDKLDEFIQALIAEWERKTSWRLIECDIREVTADQVGDESVDVIITDPPYPKAYVSLFGDLGALAARVLKPGGSLIVMTGQSYLPEYIRLLAEHLTYRWTLAYATPGGQAVQVWDREVITFWKPLLWLTKGEPSTPWVSDHISTEVNSNEKAHHAWGQSENGMAKILERFTKRGDLVLDPFLGGGTTGVVCVKEGRRFIGIDKSKDCVEKAKARIEKALLL